MSKITRLKIRDFRGISEMDVTAGAVNLFSGMNAQGKTSVLDAIAAALKGKVPPEAVRHDADRAEILVELDDGTSVHRKIPRDGRQAVKVQRDRATLNSPQAWLDELFADEGMNPVDFIKAKDRQKRLLEALPVTTTPAEVVEYLEAVGLSKSDVRGLRTDSAHAFEVFEKVAKMLADERKGVNAAVKQATQWIQQEMADVAEAEDPTDDIARVSADLFKAKADASEAENKNHERERLKTKLAGLEESIVVVRGRLTDLVSQVEDVKAAMLNLGEPQDIDGAVVEGLEAELSRLSTLKGAWDESLRRSGRIDAKAQELDAMRVRADRLDTGVKMFSKQAPAEALAKTAMPVDGLEYRDGAFYVNGTHLDQLSGAETVMVAVQFTLQKVRQKGLHLVCVDGLELLDDDQRALFFREMADSGVQLWATEVDHGRGAPDGDGVLYVVMKNGEPSDVQATAMSDSQEAQTGLSF